MTLRMLSSRTREDPAHIKFKSHLDTAVSCMTPGARVDPTALEGMLSVIRSKEVSPGDALSFFKTHFREGSLDQQLRALLVLIQFVEADPNLANVIHTELASKRWRERFMGLSGSANPQVRPLLMNSLNNWATSYREHEIGRHYQSTLHALTSGRAGAGYQPQRTGYRAQTTGYSMQSTGSGYPPPPPPGYPASPGVVYQPHPHGYGVYGIPGYPAAPPPAPPAPAPSRPPPRPTAQEVPAKLENLAAEVEKLRAATRAFEAALADYKAQRCPFSALSSANDQGERCAERVKSLQAQLENLLGTFDGADEALMGRIFTTNDSAVGALEQWRRLANQDLAPDDTPAPPTSAAAAGPSTSGGAASTSAAKGSGGGACAFTSAAAAAAGMGFSSTAAPSTSAAVPQQAAVVAAPPVPPPLPQRPPPSPLDLLLGDELPPPVPLAMPSVSVSQPAPAVAPPPFHANGWLSATPPASGLDAAAAAATAAGDGVLANGVGGAGLSSSAGGSGAEPGTVAPTEDIEGLRAQVLALAADLEKQRKMHQTALDAQEAFHKWELAKAKSNAQARISELEAELSRQQLQQQSAAALPLVNAGAGFAPFPAGSSGLTGPVGAAHIIPYPVLPTPMPPPPPPPPLLAPSSLPSSNPFASFAPPPGILSMQPPPLPSHELLGGTGSGGPLPMQLTPLSSVQSTFLPPPPPPPSLPSQLAPAASQANDVFSAFDALASVRTSSLSAPPPPPPPAQRPTMVPPASATPAAAGAGGDSWVNFGL